MAGLGSGTNFIPGDLSIPDSGNSSTATATSFTGTWTLNPFTWILVTCLSDAAGTITIQFSHDGSTVHSAITKNVTANSGLFAPLLKGYRYARVLWSGSLPTSFSLFTSYGDYGAGISNLGSNIPGDAGAQLVRSIDPLTDEAAGRIGGFVPVTKFGRAPDGIQTTATDIWDRADSTPTQQIWVAPTAARIHAIVSDSTDDDSGGTGANTIQIYGLTSWSTREISETVVMDGTNSVNTTNAFVIIHRMRVLTKGSSGPNVGTITATAATDSTITAAIRPGIGSTAMAIYGWSSLDTFFIKNWKASINKASGAAAHAVFQLRHNPEPDVELTGFNELDLCGRQSDGTSSAQEPLNPYLALAGPGILKISALASANDIDANAGFGGVLVAN